MPTCLLPIPENNEFNLSKQVFRNEAHIILEITLVVQAIAYSGSWNILHYCKTVAVEKQALAFEQ